MTEPGEKNSNVKSQMPTATAAQLYKLVSMTLMVQSVTWNAAISRMNKFKLVLKEQIPKEHYFIYNFKPEEHKDGKPD